jgi:uncharacterized protein
MLTITQINIFPVKSLDGYSVESAIVEPKGLQYDRRWMIVSSEGLFFTQRTKPEMALLKATVENEKLTISEKNNPKKTISFSVFEKNGQQMKVKVWSSVCEANIVSIEVDEWLSEILKTPCRLVKMPDNVERRIDEEYNQGNDLVGFADGYPYLFIGESSLNELNSRLTNKVSMRRFRANLVFSGGEPFEEEKWSKFSIENRENQVIPFEGLKPCGRCVVITLNPDTGETPHKKEPLKTLSTYRMKGKSIIFGMNVVFRKENWKNEILPVISLGNSIKT